jgi:hypothetical protein
MPDQVRVKLQESLGYLATILKDFTHLVDDYEDFRLNAIMLVTDIGQVVEGKSPTEIIYAVVLLMAFLLREVEDQDSREMAAGIIKGILLSGADCFRPNSDMPFTSITDGGLEALQEELREIRRRGQSR